MHQRPSKIRRVLRHQVAASVPQSETAGLLYTDPFFIVPGELTNVAKKRKVLKKKTAPARKATAIKKKTASARKTTVVKKKAPSGRSTAAVKTRQGNEGSRDQATEFFRRARAARFFPTS